MTNNEMAEHEFDRKACFDEAFLYFLSRLYEEFPIRSDFNTTPPDVESIQKIFCVTSDGSTWPDGAGYFLPDTEEADRQKEAREAAVQKMKELRDKTLIWRETFNWLIACKFVTAKYEEHHARQSFCFVTEDGVEYHEYWRPTVSYQYAKISKARLTQEGFAILRSKTGQSDDRTLGDKAIEFSKGIAGDISESAKKKFVTEVVSAGFSGLRMALVGL